MGGSMIDRTRNLEIAAVLAVGLSACGTEGDDIDASRDPAASVGGTESEDRTEPVVLDTDLDVAARVSAPTATRREVEIQRGPTARRRPGQVATLEPTATASITSDEGGDTSYIAFVKRINLGSRLEFCLELAEVG